MTTMLDNLTDHIQISENDAFIKQKKAALDAFVKQGIPTIKSEDWRYWTPESIKQNLLTSATTNDLSKKDLSNSLVLENGVQTSEVNIEGVSISNELENLISGQNPVSGISSSPISLLSTVLAPSVTVVTINQSLTTPLKIQVKSINKELESVHQRLIIQCQKGVSANIVIEHTADSIETISNTLVECVFMEDSNIEVVQVQKEDKAIRFLNTALHLYKNAEVNHISFVKDGNVTRHDSELFFYEEGSNCQMKGVSLLDKSTQFYNHIKANHSVGACECRQHFKTILTDKAISEFFGLVSVEKGAHETDSTQLNQNMLLSDSCRALSRPQLKIDADDVSCDHGSTIGQLDSEEIHYICSRGLSEDEAKTLLTVSFGQEIIEAIKNEEIKQYLQHIIESTVLNFLKNEA